MFATNAFYAFLFVSSLLVGCNARSGSAHISGNTTAPSSAFHVSQIGKPGTPQISAEQSSMVRGVEAATQPSDRSRLMLFFPNGSKRLFLFYNSPDRSMSDHVAMFPIIGTCNGYFMDGDLAAGPADNPSCTNWKPSRADRVVIQFYHGNVGHK